MCACCNEQYLRKLQSVRHHGNGVGDGVKMADSGSGSWWRSASWTSVVHVVLVTGRQMSLLDDSSEVYVKFKFANERYKTRVRVTSLIHSISYSEIHNCHSFTTFRRLIKFLHFLLVVQAYIAVTYLTMYRFSLWAL